MDLRLFAAVIRRHWKVVLSGLVAGVALALFAYGTPGFSHGKPTLQPRSQETWEVDAQLLITQPSDPYGQAMTPGNSGTEGYLSDLSGIYAAIANGSPVQKMLRADRVPGKLTAQEVIDPQTGNPLPLVAMTAQGPTRSDAARVAELSIALLRNYAAGQQAEASVPRGNRIALVVLQSGFPPFLAQGYNITTPLLVLVAVLAATIVLAFLLENVRAASGQEIAPTLLSAAGQPGDPITPPPTTRPQVALVGGYPIEPPTTVASESSDEAETIVTNDSADEESEPTSQLGESDESRAKAWRWSG